MVGQEPSDKALDKELILNPDWQRYTYHCNTQAYAAGKAHITFVLGKSTGTIELADIHLEKGLK